MPEKMQKLSIRLVREGLVPDDALREGAVLTDWERLEGARILLQTIGGNAPKWSQFLELSGERLASLENSSAIGLVCLSVSGRWFIISFGLGHVKIDPSKIEHDFGLRVVLNSVDPKQIRSADVRTPDENTLSKRSQTSRGSDQTAFLIDIERDIVRGLAGKPKDQDFAARVAGSDSLTIDKLVTVDGLPEVCSSAYTVYQSSSYEQNFKWIDQVKHVRDDALILSLENILADKINRLIVSGSDDELQLTFPVIYDPEKSSFIMYRGFRSQLIFTDLEIGGFLEALADKGKSEITLDDLKKYSVHEVSDEGKDIGGRWSIKDCLATEIELDGTVYVLSCGRWYKIDNDLASDVRSFFDNAARFELPEAFAGENEEKYNKRLAASSSDFLCLDRKLVTPTGSSTKIEICDFLSKNCEIIHVKDKTSSSRLSHLFNQGTVSGRVLILDGPARDFTRDKIVEAQSETGQTGYLEKFPGASDAFDPSNFTIVYGVISSNKEFKLPFFSMLTFRQAARELRLSGFKCAISWIKKPEDAGQKKGKKAKSDDD